MRSSRIAIHALSAVALGALLTACGGGGSGSSGNTVAPSGQVENRVTPAGLATIAAGQKIAIASDAKVFFDALQSHAWTITQVSGTPAANPPVIVDPSCASAVTSPGAKADGANPGRNATSLCQTFIVLPADLPNSEWEVTNIARSSSGSASGKFVLKVDALPKTVSGFSLNVPTLPQAFATDSTAVLSVVPMHANTISPDSPIRYEWSQVSGPAQVAIAGSSSPSMSFFARAAGDYVFKVKATAVFNGKSEVVEGAVVARIEAPEAVKSYSVSAGSIQAVELNKPAKLAGTVTGDVTASELSYKWRQVGGPSVSIFGDDSLMPEFLPRTAGDYEFELTVSRSGAKPSSKKATTLVAAYAPSTTAPFFTVSAGAAQVAALNEVTSLRGAVANGTPAATNLTYKWVQKSGPYSVNLSGANSLTASFVPMSAGDFTFEFSATDGSSTKTDQVTVTATAPANGFFTVSAGSLKSAPVSTTVSLAGSVGGTVNASELRYKWVQVSGPEATLFGNESLTPQFAANVAGDYVFELQVTRTGSQPQTMTSRTLVMVYSTDDSSVTPFFAVSAGDAQVSDPAPVAVVLQGEIVTGQPAPTNVAYTWTQLDGPNVVLNNANTLKASFVAQDPGLYVFELKAVAGGVVKTATTSVQVLAPAVEDQPLQ